MRLIHANPYQRYPRVMVKGCATKSVKDLNRLPSTNGISSTLSPSTLITGDACPDFKDVSVLNFGSYAQVHRHNNPTNTPKARTVGAIALHESGNAQRGWIFMSLATGKEIHGYTWDVLPVADEVIERVHEIALGEGQPLITNNFK